MKKIIALFMVVLMALVLAACSKKCVNCGKSSDDGYMIDGEYYCRDCAPIDDQFDFGDRQNIR